MPKKNKHNTATVAVLHGMNCNLLVQPRSEVEEGGYEALFIAHTHDAGEPIKVPESG